MVRNAGLSRLSEALALAVCLSLHHSKYVLVENSQISIHERMKITKCTYNCNPSLLSDSIITELR